MAFGCIVLAGCGGQDAQHTPADNDSPGVILGDLGTGNDFLAEGSSNSEATSGGACRPPEPVSSCVGETYAGESIPLDIYVLFDQSGSMCTCIEPGASQLCPDPACTQTRLDAVRSAMNQFLLDPESTGISVGLGNFGQQPIGQASCDVRDYEAPRVGFGELPAHASLLQQALARIEPTGETPTGAALRGACQYTSDWKRQVPGHQVVILLLTDGKPEAPVTCRDGQGACCPSLSDAAAAAAECRSNAQIDTYVLGVGPLLDNLEQIATAGGTGHAYLVEGRDVSTQVLDALNRIRGAAAIPCQLRLPQRPQGTKLSYDRINLEYQSSSCQSTGFYSVPSAADCGSEDGWHYDDPSNPQLIKLCPRSCDRVSSFGGSLFYSVGCTTQVR